MEGEAVNWLNNIGAGTLIAVVIFIISASAGIVTFLSNLLNKNSKKVKQETIDNMNFQSLVETVGKLTSTVDRLEKRIEKMDDRLDKEEREHDKLIKEMNDKINNLTTDLKNVDDSMGKIIDSNQGTIRSFIINEYHKWMELQYIDVYSLSVIEDRYEVYRSFNGNTFVKDLMVQMRQLPSKPKIVNEKGEDPIKYFELHPDHHPKFRHLEEEDEG